MLVIFKGNYDFGEFIVILLPLIAPVADFPLILCAPIFSFTVKNCLLYTFWCPKIDFSCNFFIKLRSIFSSMVCELLFQLQTSFRSVLKFKLSSWAFIRFSKLSCFSYVGFLLEDSWKVSCKIFKDWGLLGFD